MSGCALEDSEYAGLWVLVVMMHWFLVLKQCFLLFLAQQR